MRNTSRCRSSRSMSLMLAVEVESVQVAAAVIQQVQVLAGRQGQRGQVAQRIVLMRQRALQRTLLMGFPLKEKIKANATST